MLISSDGIHSLQSRFQELLLCNQKYVTSVRTFKTRPSENEIIKSFFLLLLLSFIIIGFAFSLMKGASENAPNKEMHLLTLTQPFLKL